MTLTSHEHVSAGVPVAGPPTSGVSVVIPCRNESGYIEGVLDALRAQDYPAHEIVIADSGSTDDTIALINQYAARHPECVIRIADAHGANISAALNAGIAASRYEMIVRMDAHSRPAADYVRRCVTALERSDAAIVGGVWQIRPGGLSAMATGIARAVAHRMGAGDAAYRLRSAAGPRVVDTVPFGCFRRSHWNSIGGYNEHLLINEDYEFNYRTRVRGGTIVLDPEIQCEYFARPTLGTLSRQYFRYGWWKGRMLRLHPRSIRLRQAIPAVFVPFWIIATAIAVTIPSARPLLAGAVLLYFGVLAAAAVHAARGEWRLVAFIAASFAVIHTMWSTGFWLVFLTGSSALGRRRPGGRRPRVGLTGAQLVGALAAIAVLAVVAPFVMAMRVNRGRIDRATRQVLDIAAAVRTLPLRPQTAADTTFVFAGPGARPLFLDVTWKEAHTLPLPARAEAPWTADPWGNYYIVYPPAPDSHAATARWVISAGPNGILETPLRQPLTSATILGDDVGIRLE